MLPSIPRCLFPMTERQRRKKERANAAADDDVMRQIDRQTDRHLTHSRQPADNNNTNRRSCSHCSRSSYHHHRNAEYVGESSSGRTISVGPIPTSAAMRPLSISRCVWRKRRFCRHAPNLSTTGATKTWAVPRSSSHHAQTLSCATTASV